MALIEWAGDTHDPAAMAFFIVTGSFCMRGEIDAVSIGRALLGAGKDNPPGKKNREPEPRGRFRLLPDTPCDGRHCDSYSMWMPANGFTTRGLREGTTSAIGGRTMRRLMNIFKKQSWATALGLALVAGGMAMTSGCGETEPWVCCAIPPWPPDSVMID